MRSFLIVLLIIATLLTNTFLAKDNCKGKNGCKRDFPFSTMEDLILV